MLPLSRKQKKHWAMARKISITLDEAVLEFIDSQTNNRSQLINRILNDFKQQQALKELEAAYIEQSKDEDARDYSKCNNESQIG